MKTNFNILMNLYNIHNSYITATVKFVEEYLNIDIDEFSTSDLPEEWLQCLYKEAKENKNLKPEVSNKVSFFDLIKNKEK